MPVDDAIGTLALMLGAGLAARLVADVARVPAMLLLIAAGVIVSPGSTSRSRARVRSSC